MFKFIVVLESHNSDSAKRVVVMADSADEAMSQFMFGTWQAVDAYRA